MISNLFAINPDDIYYKRCSGIFAIKAFFISNEKIQFISYESHHVIVHWSGTTLDPEKFDFVKIPNPLLR